MGEDGLPKKSTARATVENIKSWIGIAVGAVAAAEFWDGIAFVVLFAIAAIVVAMIVAFPVLKSWFG